MGRVIILFTLFFYVYPIAFVGIPFSTNVLMAIIGFVIFIVQNLKSTKIRIRKDILYLILSVLVISCLGFCKSFATGIFERLFSLYFYMLFVAFLDCWFIRYLYDKFRIRHLWTDVLFDFVIVVVIQELIALVFALFPNLMEIAIGMQKADSMSLEMVNETMNFRLIGFGSMFFGAGVATSVALICLFELYKCKMYNKWFLLCLYVFVFIMGMAMARTTLIGLFISFWIFVDRKNLIYSFFKIQSTVIGICAILAICIVVIFQIVDWDTINSYANFAFEMFFNYYDNNELTTDSTEQLATLYIYPDNIKTFLFGDGLWADPANPSLYYKGTDVGWLRMIFYFGVLGILVFIVYVFMSLRYFSKRLSGKCNQFFVTLFILFFVLNFKGFIDLFIYLFLFGICSESVSGGKMLSNRNN